MTGSDRRDLQPLNCAGAFRSWPPIDPGVFLDMNPTVVRAADGGTWVVFCRYPVSPQPGQGSIWVVAVDAALAPVGRPRLLVEEGIDPRAITIGDRLFVFYALLERDAEGRIDGSVVVMAEFGVIGSQWLCASAYRLPKFPLDGQRSAEAQEKWEKNWVPFPIDDDHIGVIYAHEPWDVITIEIPRGEQPRFQDVHRGPGLVWHFGTIRGGTPPLRYDDESLITFFHAAQVVGSRRVYTVGACVFMSRPPYAPRLFTPRPLLVAPYKSTARRFGWNFAGSIVFPAGALDDAAGFHLVSGLDDGEIATFTVTRAELEPRLAPPEMATKGIVRSPGAGAIGIRLDGLLCAPEGGIDLDDDPVVNFARITAGRGRTLIDIGARAGGYAIPLAGVFARVVAFEPQPALHRWLDRNRSLNGCESLVCRLAWPGSDGEPMIDDHGWRDVDLIKIDLRDRGLSALDGARSTIDACRPLLLCKVGAEPAAREALAGFLADIGYTCEDIFPLTPAWLVGRPADRSGEHDWFF